MLYPTCFPAYRQAGRQESHGLREFNNLKADLDHHEFEKDKRLGGEQCFIDALNFPIIGDRCEAKSSFRKRFFDAFLSLKKHKPKNAHMIYKNKKSPISIPDPI